MIEHTFHDTYTTKTGLQLRIREIRPDDAQHLLTIFDGMSADSRYRRFHRPVENLTDEQKWEEAERIARLVGESSSGLIAFADYPNGPDYAVAAARFVCLGGGVAEAAMSVIDSVQRQGVGTHLMHMLAGLACELGVRQLTASIQHDNKAIWKILQSLPYEIRRTSTGSFAEVVVDLTRPKTTAVFASR